LVRHVLKGNEFVPIFRRLFLVSFYSGFGIAASFARGILLARILGTDQFGLAVILISILGAMDLFADAGIDRFVIQNRFGHRFDMMRTSHAYRVFGSGIVGGVVLILSYPLALIFNHPPMWSAIAILSGVIVLRGFVNLDYKLEQRQHRFGAETRIDIARFTIELLVLLCIALTTKSYWAVVIGAYANAFVHLLISHVMARGKYSFIPRRRVVGLVARFSTPIYINAALLFAAMQGDRLVVAASFTSHQLALYAAACALGQGAIALLGKVIMNVFLPVFSSVSQQREKGRIIVNRIGMLLIAGSVIFVVALTIAAPPLVTLLYGPEYIGLRAIIFASAIVQMIQIEQAWLTTLLMANGLTREFPKITIMRAIAFPIAVVFASWGLDILAIPLAFAIGTLFSLIMSYRAAIPLKLIHPYLMVVSFMRIALAIAAVAVLIVT